jgi:hypothetical protein
MTILEDKINITFSPFMKAEDPVANYWMRQVTLRLRREICWLHNLRGISPYAASDSLPPFTEKSSEILDLVRFQDKKAIFFRSDVTAKYLSDQLNLTYKKNQVKEIRGSFSWITHQLSLDDASIFVLALAMTTSFDSCAGEVIACCMNDPLKTKPNLALAQKLWDQPQEILSLANPDHPLFRLGLLQFKNPYSDDQNTFQWETGLSIHPIVLRKLLYPGSSLPTMLKPTSYNERENGNVSENIDFVASRIKVPSQIHLQVVPILGDKNAMHINIAQNVAHLNKTPLVEFIGNPGLLQDRIYRNAIATYCWLNGYYLFLDIEAKELPTQSIPIVIFSAFNDKSQLNKIPSDILLPTIKTPKFTYQQRLNYWSLKLGDSKNRYIDYTIECARRFRYEKKNIQSICSGLLGLNRPLTKEDFIHACLSEMDIELGDLAQKISPRFQDEQIFLPPKQSKIFNEILISMTSLSHVHHNWGTAKAWNESGISVLFAGAPGTGKTMAAEVLANRLNLPVYRIDLSQVVNKYIGETEKNLKRLFDAADKTDLILFFDEADSLFGRRTEVKDAHDRYANLEISYLLERMERFKGMAILATNRKKDLDDAFLRRLRYIIDFPMPEIEQRKKIWKQVIPKNVDPYLIDFDFLAQRFSLAGGHIRSIIFNACLQSAEKTSPIKSSKYPLKMEAIVRAIKREYEKLNRSISLEKFGPYIPTIQSMNSIEDES